MKVTTLLILRRLLIPAILFLISTTAIISQIKIKDRVEITPKAATYNTITKNNENEKPQIFQLNYTAEVTGLSLSYYSSLAHTTISPGSTNCGTPSGYTVMHYFWPVTCNGEIVRFNDSQCDDDCEPGEYADYGGTFGIFNQGPLMFGGAYLDDNGNIQNSTGYLYIDTSLINGEAYPGACGGTLGLYGFNGTGYWQIPQYSITITRASFCPPIAITFFDDVSSIMYMDALDMQIGLQDACGKTTTVLGPTPMKYYVKITNGKEWGYVYNRATGQYGDSISCTASDSDTSFTFLSMNQQPSEDQQVMLKVWYDDTSFTPATREITVQSAKCMLLSLTNPQMRPGDTVSISIMENLGDGTSIPYPPYQLFSIRLNTDGKYYGKLHCLATNDTGTVLTGLPQPFEFIAADSIFLDSVVVDIEANVQVIQGVPSTIGIEPKERLQTHTTVMANKQTKVSNITPIRNEMNQRKIESRFR